MINFKLGLFALFNSFLPIFDVGSDGATCIDHLIDGQYNWALATFLPMWNPFFLHLLHFLWKFVCSCCTCDPDFDACAEFKKVFLHLPLRAPIENLKKFERLRQIGFGTDQMDGKHWEEVEKIQFKAGILAMQESFSEAGPQTVIQLVIIFSTGRITTTQMISIPISILSLAWGSSRAFFILRRRDEADPDPGVWLVCFRILPWELLMVTNSTIYWTCFTGLVGKYAIFGVFFCFVITLSTLWLKEKWDIYKGDLQSLQGENFKLISSMTAVWLLGRVKKAKMLEILLVIVFQWFMKYRACKKYFRLVELHPKFRSDKIYALKSASP